MTDEEKLKRVLNILQSFKQIRQPYEAGVDECYTFANPGRRKIIDNAGNRGKRTGQEVFDGSAISAANLLTDGICGYSASKSFRWFNYTLPGTINFPRTSGMRVWSGKRMDEYPEVKIFIENWEEVMYSAFLRSNFYDILPEVVRDGVVPGTVTTPIEEDIKKGRIVFTVPHFRECYIAEDRFGVVNTNYRIYLLTLTQLADKFGYARMEEIDPAFKQQYERNPYQEKEVLHAIYPREIFDHRRLDKKNKPWESVWILMSPQKFIVEDGYDDQSFVTWRWRRNSEELYGRSPIWDAIVDIKVANQQAKTNLIAGHKMAEPPMIAPDDLRGLVQNTPGGWTFIRAYNKEMLPQPLNTGIQLPYAIDQQERTVKAIREHLHADFFLLLSQAAFNKVELTATQVIEMGGEKAAILGTRIGRFETEYLNPVHDIVFNIEKKAGRGPNPPDILLELGGNIEVDYLGPLAQAQKRMFKSQVIRAGIQMIGESAAVWPEVTLVVDPIKTLRDYLDSSGFPAKLFRTDEAIDQILKMKQEQEAMMQMVEAAPKIAKASASASKPIEPGSPMDAMMGKA